MFSWSSTTPGRVVDPPSKPQPRHQSAPVTVEVTRVFYSRQQHLQSFLSDSVLHRSIKRVSRGTDDTTYDTAFQTVSGVALFLRVHLPQREGAVPSMFLWGIKATHPWLREEGLTNRVIGYEPIASTDQHWQSCNILLGRAVNDVVKHFQINPPAIIQFTNESLQRLQPQPASSGSHSQEHHDILDIPIPQVPTSFPELESMSIHEVENTLLLDDTSWKAWLLTKNLSDEMKTQHNFHQELVHENYNTAKANLLEESQLQALYTDVEALKKEFTGCLEKCRQAETSYQKIMGSPEDQHRRILRLLHAAEREAFKEAEEFGNTWLSEEDGDNKNKNADDFIQDFMAKRKLYHKRAAMMEKISSMSSSQRS